MILGQENKDHHIDKRSTGNQVETDSKANCADSLVKKKDSRFWLSIDLELDGLEKFEPTATNGNQPAEQNGELDKLEQAFGHQQLDNKENLSKVNLLKIKQQMMDSPDDPGQHEPNLLELLDADC